MKNTKLNLTLPLCFLFTSCASMQQAWVEQNCSESAAYAQGMNDAKDDKPMNLDSYSTYCTNSKDAILLSYRKGYENRIASDQSESTTVTTPANNGTIINLGFGNGIHLGTSLPGQTQAPATSGTINPRAWFCSVEAFASKFEEFGPTKFETKRAVLKKCGAASDEMHCQDISCKKNL